MFHFGFLKFLSEFNYSKSETIIRIRFENYEKLGKKIFQSYQIYEKLNELKSKCNQPT